MNEPSVLDYIKSLFNKKPERLRFSLPEDNSSKQSKRKKYLIKESFPFQSVVGVCLAFVAQLFLEPPHRYTIFAGVFYVFAGYLIWRDFSPSTIQIKRPPMKQSGDTIRLISFSLSLILLIISFFLFSNNRFTLLNGTIWVAALVFFFISVWEKTPKGKITLPRDNHWHLILILSFSIAVFLRFYQLAQVPGEMFSDHAEKLLDVSDVLRGQYSIFFPRNTGREAFQFYLTALIVKTFGTGITFISLKIGTALAGLLTLPYIYLLGKELADRWVGLAALFFAGIAYWPNVISRVGLRFPLYALFAAPAIYYLVLGLRYGHRNHFILAGIAIGLGLHGYSPFRIVPLVALVGFGFALFANSSRIYRKKMVWYFSLMAFTALIIFLPLLRYALENPVIFGIRAFSRLTAIEQVLPEPVFKVFLTNLWNALTMFFYSNGEIWVHSVPYRPALDVISAVFLFFGIIILLKDFAYQRRWENLFLLALIPLLMLPSILSLAFPRENPSLNRTSAAIIPVFIVSGYGFVNLSKRINQKLKDRITKNLFFSLIAVLLICACFLNYKLVFNDYSQQYLQKAWNTSEIGAVINGFVADGGDPNLAFVIPYPHWVDTRLVGINAGYPDKDYALQLEQIFDTRDLPDPKIFIIFPEDQKTIQEIMNVYPEARAKTFISKQPGKNFIIIRIDGIPTKE